MSISSTRASRKPLLAVAALAATGGMFAALLAGFLALSAWAEREAGAYPFSHQEWLRYLLPSTVDGDAELKIMLAGPSTVRENLRVEQVKAAFPEASVLQGAISLATIEDVTTGLQYMEAVHGAEALPDVLALGVSPRFIAGIPDWRPFRMGIDSYSPHYRIVEADGDMTLVPKSPLESLAARTSFLSKQSPRFITALWASMRWFLQEVPMLREAIDRAGASDYGQKLGRVCFDWPAEGGILDCLAKKIAPYKYAELRPPAPEVLETWLTEPETWWHDVFAWDPDADPRVRERLAEFRSFVDGRGIRLLVLNMPERDMARERYQTDYGHYLDLLDEAFGPERVADLRLFLRGEEFYDAEHSVPEGSRRLTGAVIPRIREVAEAPASVAAALPMGRDARIAEKGDRP